MINLFSQMSAISESIVRQCEKLLDKGNQSNIPISIIYHSWVLTKIRKRSHSF